MFGPALLAVGAIVVAIVIVGQLARRRLRRRYPPTGRFVDVDGIRFHLDERGREHDGPTVVLEAGAMAPGLVWEPVQDAIARFARVVSYDRAGLGWSERSPRARTAPEMADELAGLLAAAAVPAPYVLVGHSVGGTIVRVFAHRHRDLVAGMVLLDASHEDQFERAPAALRDFMISMSTRMPAVFAVLRQLVRAGIVAVRPSLVPASLGPLPAGTVAAIRARIASEPAVVATMAEEMRGVDAGNDAVRALGIRSLGPVPLVVVSHGRPEGVPPQFGPEIAAAYEALWQELQVAQLALSPIGRRIVADGIGHNVPTEAPALVVDVVREVVAASAARGAAGTRERQTA